MIFFFFILEFIIVKFVVIIVIFARLTGDYNVFVAALEVASRAGERYPGDTKWRVRGKRWWRSNIYDGTLEVVEGRRIEVGY